LNFFKDRKWKNKQSTQHKYIAFYKEEIGKKGKSAGFEPAPINNWHDT
jgi:hypothetical protein